MKTTLNIFTYRGEEELIEMCVAQAQAALPRAIVHLHDDAADPLPARVVGVLVDKYAVRYHQTEFVRPGNLDGEECIKGELEAMCYACAQDGNSDGVMFKIDPDTLLLDMSQIVKAFDDGAPWFSHSSSVGLFAGMCYGMRVAVLHAVRAQAERIAYPEPRFCPEDQIIGSLCMIECAKKPYAYMHQQIGNNRALIGAFDVLAMDKGEAAYKEALALTETAYVVTVGNTGVRGLPRAYRVKFMRDIIAHHQQLARS